MYYKNSNNELFVDPILSEHAGLVELTEPEFNAQLVANNTPTSSEIKAARILEIDRRLIEIDSEGIRPLRAIVNNTYTQEDVTKLDLLDLEAANLRAERLTLV